MKIIHYLFCLSLLITCTAHPMDYKKAATYYETKKKNSTSGLLNTGVKEKSYFDLCAEDIPCLKICSKGDLENQAEGLQENCCGKNCKNKCKIYCIGTLVGSGFMACYCCCTMMVFFIIYLKLRFNI